MKDVSEITGIPADRIYKWEKGTKPGDAEDLLKIRSYLEGKLENRVASNLESLPNEMPPESAAMKILSVLADAFKEQARALAHQAEIMRSIESKMAQETTQANMETNLKAVRKDVTTLVERQSLAVEEMRDHFAQLGVQRKNASKDVRKKANQSDGNG